MHADKMYPGTQAWVGFIGCLELYILVVWHDYGFMLGLRTSLVPLDKPVSSYFIFYFCWWGREVCGESFGGNWKCLRMCLVLRIRPVPSPISNQIIFTNLSELRDHRSWSLRSFLQINKKKYMMEKKTKEYLETVGKTLICTNDVLGC